MGPFPLRKCEKKNCSLARITTVSLIKKCVTAYSKLVQSPFYLFENTSLLQRANFRVSNSQESCTEQCSTNEEDNNPKTLRNKLCSFN